MSLVYAVRCNFTRPDLEQEWNDWYGGPKLREMMTHRGFLSGQRYRAVGLDDRIRYLALWVVESPAAFETPEYKTRWGFVQWAPYISDWSRNLYRVCGESRGRDTATVLATTNPSRPGTREAGAGRASPVTSPIDDWISTRLDVPAGGTLHVITLETDRLEEVVMSHRPDLLWFEAVGLDRSIPGMGVIRVGVSGPPPAPLAADVAAGVRETIYQPISVRLRSTRGPRESEVRA